jgi:hypothetical protein
MQLSAFTLYSMTNPTPLSPAAQAVLDAYYTEADLRDRVVTDCEMLAAALRAATDQLYDSPSQDYLWGIAAELEGAQ